MGNRLLVAACSALALLGCARKTVKIPTADGTPPLSALDVVAPGSRHLVMLGGDAPGSVELGPADSVILIGLGEDRDGGVKDVALVGNVIAVCGDAGKDGKPLLKEGSFARRHVLPGRPGQRVPGSKSTRFVLRAADFHKLCGPLELKAVSGAAGVRTVNFHGASSMSPTLEFRVAAPDPGVPVTTQAPQGSQTSPAVYGPLPASEYPITPLI